MKKLTILFSIMLVSFSLAKAQTGLGVGVKAGANFANMDFENIDTDTKTGFHFGAFVAVPLGEQVALQPEIQYSTYGTKFDDGDDINFSYLSIPILLKFNVSVLDLYVGPQLGILTDNDDKPSIPTDNQFKNTDWSFVLGAGIDLPLNLEVGGRYIYGINDISDVPEFGSVNNRMWQIYAALTLFGER